ncbi:MAG: phosphoribosylformylglycinamidine synthase subunit PurS, partial [Stellaceae bacterium]
MKARVQIMPRQGVLDPQGKAIAHALAALGFKGVGEVRQGKVIDLELAETDPARARDTVDAMCRRLLANTVIESY